MENLSWIVSIISIILGALAGWGAAAIKIGKYIQTVDDLKTKVSALEKDIKEHSNKLTECSTKIDERTQSYASTLTKRKSPVSLNEKGEALLKESGSDKFILENKDEFVEKIKNKNPHSAYDIQEYADEVISTLKNHERIIPFKDYAYKEGLDLEQSIFIVMGLYLRDIALSLLGYKPEDIDKSDPAKI